MQINNTIFNCELFDIISELQLQLNINGIPLLQKTRNSPDDIQVQCPYHADGQERKPSAGIRKSDGQFHCFACNETHTLPEVISFCFGHTDDILGVYGWQWLTKNFLTIEVEERKDVLIDCSRTLSNSFDREFVTEGELDKYRYYHPYWKKRGITDERIIELFDLGYDKETDCITMPVRDIHGNCLFVARRSVKTKYFCYPKGVQKPLYGLYELELTFPDWNKKYPDIVVCESMIDALSFWQVGKYAVALNGLGNGRQMKELSQLQCRKLILCTDMDEAGQRARKRIRASVKNKLITEYILPNGRKDANECTEVELDNLEEIF